MKISSVHDVVRADLCAGCGLCQSIAGSKRVQVAIDEQGFYRPQLLASDAVAWPTIQQVCPGIVLRQEHNQHATRQERTWGPIQVARVGYASNSDVRRQASSGGALSAILIYLLESDQVDAVLHVGSDTKDPFLTVVSPSTDREQVLAKAGSRYTPTAPLIGLQRWLDDDQRRIAFVGKPCDVAALRTYGRLAPQIERQIVIFVSFFCAGVPSLLATYDLVQALGLNRAQVHRLHYRGRGWPGQATAIDREGREFSMSYEASWGKILGTRLQFRCKLCPDGVGEFADIVFGDAWHLCQGQPSFEERPGQSLILARTTTGSQLLTNAESASYIHTDEFKLDTLGLIQPYQQKRRQAIAARLLATRLAGRPVPHFQGFYLHYNSWQGGSLAFVRQFGGMLRRLVSNSCRPTYYHVKPKAEDST